MQILTMIRKFLLSVLQSKNFVYVYTALPGATATPKCFKLASSGAEKLSKKLEGLHSMCYNSIALLGFLNDCACKGWL